MAKIDISSYKIRVILSRYLYNIGSPQCPLDVEGTVLFIDSDGDNIQNLINRGLLLNILCDYELRLNDTSVLVRWDNDMKNWYSSGVFAFRAGKISRCKDIWGKQSTINISTVSFSVLKPDTGSRLYNAKMAKEKAYAKAYGGTYTIEEPSLMDAIEYTLEPPRPPKMVMSTRADYSQLEGKIIRGRVERQHHDAPIVKNKIEWPRMTWDTGEVDNAKPTQWVTYESLTTIDDPMF